MAMEQLRKMLHLPNCRLKVEMRAFLDSHLDSAALRTRTRARHQQAVKR